jgi:hypothetical protein
MKMIRVAVLIVAGAFVAILAAQAPPPAGTVDGTVVNSVTGAGIGGASVSLSAGASARYQTTSDAVGHFKITGLSPGNYRATADKDGFASPPPELPFNLNGGLRVASDSDPVKIELKLTPLDTVRGLVLNPDGTPAVGVDVSLYPNITADNAITDKEGRFALAEIRPGSYTLIAMPAKSTRPEEASDGTKTAIVTTYYPAAAEASLAQPIVLRGLGNLNDFEIRMQTALVHRVRGIVLDEQGKPSPGAELTLLPIPQGTPEPMGLSMRAPGRFLFALGLRPGPSGAPKATATAGGDGRFEFPAVQSGDWRINAEPVRNPPSRGAADAFVGRVDVEDLQIHVAKPFKLSGTIEWKAEDAGNPLASNPKTSLSLLTLINPDNNEFVSNGIVESGGVLFESILPGRYKILVKPGLKAQIFLGDYDVTEQAFTAGANGPRLRFAFQTWSGSVRGTVEKGDGATVVLVPQRTEGAALGQTAVCGVGGSFELTEVSPGDYYIAGFDHIEGLSPSAAMLSLVASRGTNVKVEEHSAADVMLSLIPLPQ